MINVMLLSQAINRVTIWDVSPSCRAVGSFIVAHQLPELSELSQRGLLPTIMVTLYSYSMYFIHWTLRLILTNFVCMIKGWKFLITKEEKRRMRDPCPEFFLKQLSKEKWMTTHCQRSDDGRELCLWSQLTRRCLSAAARQTIEMQCAPQPHTTTKLAK